MTLCLLLMLFGCTRAFYELKGIYNVLLKVLIYTSISLLANSMLSTLHYVKSYLDCPKSLRTARTLYEIKGVGVQLCGKTFGEKISF